MNDKIKVSRVAFGKRLSNQQKREMVSAGMIRIRQAFTRRHGWKIGALATLEQLAKFATIEARRESKVAA